MPALCYHKCRCSTDACSEMSHHASRRIFIAVSIKNILVVGDEAAQKQFGEGSSSLVLGSLAVLTHIIAIISGAVVLALKRQGHLNQTL